MMNNPQSQPYPALNYLYSELRKAKHALGQAESRKGVTQEELSNLNRKIENLDWLIALTHAKGYDFPPD